MRRLAVLVCLLSVLPPSGAWAGAPQATPPQVPALPPRDQAAPVVGSSRLRGRVIAADTGQPLRKALVRLSAPEIRESRSTATAADGQFEFKDLPKGRYTVTASKGSYVMLAYGQTRALEPGRPIELGESQAIEKIDIRLPRGGIVTGRVVDEFGEPVADAAVAPMRLQYFQGRRRLMASGRPSMTNDIGEFRLFGLAPGEYYLSATLRGGFSMMDRSDDRSGYAPTYYPGTSDAASAQRLTVGVGQTLGDLTLPLVPAQTATIAGIVLDLEGRRAALGSVMALPRGGMFLGMGPSGGPIRPDGTFLVSGVPPGDYVLRAMLPMGANGYETPASANVTVNGQDVTGVQLVPTPPLPVTGRVIAQDGGSPPLSPALIRLVFSPLAPDDVGPGAFVEPVAPHDDFSFDVKAPPGRMALRVTVMDPAWGLKAVRLRGADVTDGGIDVRPGADLSDLEVELTHQRPEVSGYVADAKGARATNYTVVIFPQDRDLWGTVNRYNAVGRPDQSGRFRIRTLPAGDYYATAVDFVEPGRWMDPEFLESVRTDAQRFSLGESETKTLDLRIREPR